MLLLIEFPFQVQYCDIFLALLSYSRMDEHFLWLVQDSPRSWVSSFG